MIIPNWNASNNIKAAMLCKTDLMSSSIHDTQQSIKLPDEQNVFWLNQVHGNESYYVSLSDMRDIIEKRNINNIITTYDLHLKNRLSASYKNSLVSADASYTDYPHIVCAVKTADCLPILITNRKGTWVSAIHAGWRGLLGGIISSTIKEYPGNNSELIAWIGPGICQNHFEVGEDVADLFTKFDPDRQKTIIRKSDICKKWHINLLTIAQCVLNQLGISEVSCSNICTYCNQNLFYSYRRDGSSTGRLITLIWRDG